MDRDRVQRALDDAETRLTESDDLADYLAYLIGTCEAALEVDAVGVMVRSVGGGLALLAASTHRSAELELHQSQIDEGPCVDAADGDDPVAVAGESVIRRRWPRFGPAMVDAGFLAVHSAPLRSARSPFGAMALFRRDEIAFEQAEDQAAQGFADLVSRAVLADQNAEPESVHQLVDAALGSRVEIERAKGILAQVAGVDMAEAYQLLLARAADRGESLTVTAEGLVDDVLRGEISPG